jgi:zinc protease
MAAEGLTGDELTLAKRYLTGAFPLRFDSNRSIAGYLVSMQEDGLGIDYIDRRNDLIEAVTLEDVRRVAARLMKPDQLSIVVVGKPAGL